MSLLLKKSFESAAKASARRRLLATSSSIISGDSWFPSAERSFLQQHRTNSSSSRSLATINNHISWREDDDNNISNDLPKHSSHYLASYNIGILNSSLSRVSLTPAATRILRMSDAASRRAFGTFTTTTHHHQQQQPLVRYARPPSSIRSSMALSSLMATERSACDFALRALTTWTHHNHNHSIHQHQHSYSQYSHSHPMLRAFGTNSDGSRVRDPNIARSGIRQTKIPMPPSGDPNKTKSLNRENVMEEINTKSKTVVLPALLSGLKTVLSFLLNLPKNLFFYIMNPSEVTASWNHIKKVVKDEIDHYWVGTKLLWADLKTARALIRRTLRGSSLTRRERKQLLRTSSDLFRLIPFSMFLIIPLMEFALPFALKIFPNLLPSTFQDSLKAEENMKRELQSRIAMAQFFQETLEELAKEQKRSATHLKEEIQESGTGDDNIDKSVLEKQEQSAVSFLSFMEQARSGDIIPNDVIVQYAHYFKDDLTLDNMPRMQLINMCKYMGIPPYGTDSFLRFQLRHRMRSLQEDDQRILWEGIESLTKMELREACQERGMRSTGLSKDAYTRALQQWLELSVKQNVPTSLLIMSRAFFLREEMFERESDDGSKTLAGLADAISGLDKEVVNEVILDVATSQEKLSDPGVRKIKLEVLMKQNELIEQEQAEREEAAAKKKEEKSKKETESEVADALFLQSESAPTLELGDADASKEARHTSENETANDSKMDEDLSAEEMHAISQLVSADPVHRERADLESIKAALQEKKDVEQNGYRTEDSGVPDTVERSENTKPEPMSSEESDKLAALYIKGSVDEALKLTDDLRAVVDTENESIEAKQKQEENEDPVVARLKRRIESMVDKIEVQLSDVQLKIGDKLHVLDKDMDGIMSVEEIAEALQLVLKRKISVEEAYEIAQQMDDNKDGVFTVQELIQWVETNQLVKFVEEGRDREADAVIEKQSAAEQLNQQEESQGTAGHSSDQTKK